MDEIMGEALVSSGVGVGWITESKVRADESISNPSADKLLSDTRGVNAEEKGSLVF